jgi:hypothetical protein
MSANEERGEVPLLLDGSEFVLRPSYEAIEAIENQTGKGIVALFEAARAIELTSGETVTIVHQCIRAWGKATGDTGARAANRERIREMIIEAEGGLVGVQLRLAVLLGNYVSGGYTASGEAKAATGTMTTSETPAAA